MKNLDFLGWIAFVILLISGIDAGLFGIFHFRFLDLIFGTGLLGRLFSVFSGVSAGYLIWRTLPQGAKAI